MRNRIIRLQLSDVFRGNYHKVFIICSKKVTKGFSGITNLLQDSETDQKMIALYRRDKNLDLSRKGDSKMNTPIAENIWEIVDITDMDKDLTANISPIDENGWCGIFCSGADVKEK